MAGYEEVKYSKTQIKKAGKTFIDPQATEDEKNHAIVLINNWRAAHAFPLQVIYVHLRDIAPKDAIVAQRLKRLYSITRKLSRFPMMSLTTMQDIGGCRVIVDSLPQVGEMVNRLKKSRMRHDIKENYDYITSSKPDGYRGYHLVFSYFSEKNPKYNGLFIEVQIRTRIQHLWATAVEVMDAFTGEPLKIGEGDPQNRHFFILASKLLEIYENSGGNVDAVKGSAEILEFYEYDQQHHILNKLRSIQESVGLVESMEALGQEYYMLRHNRLKNLIEVKSFPKQALEQATEEYSAAESTRDPNEDVVLVSTSSTNMLKKAYPNYFSDITEFITLLDSFME